MTRVQPPLKAGVLLVMVDNVKCITWHTFDLPHLWCLLQGNWKTLKAGTTETGTGTGPRTPFFAYCFDNQVSSRRPPCGTPRLADKNSDLYMLA